MIVTATEFKTNLGKYLEMAMKQDIFITKNGKNIARGALVVGELVNGLLADHLRDLLVRAVGLAAQKQGGVTAVHDGLRLLVVLRLKLAHGLQNDGDADVPASGHSDGLLDLRDGADIGELVEDEMHRGPGRCGRNRRRIPIPRSGSASFSAPSAAADALVLESDCSLYNTPHLFFSVFFDVLARNPCDTCIILLK